MKELSNLRKSCKFLKFRETLLIEYKFQGINVVFQNLKDHLFHKKIVVLNGQLGPFNPMHQTEPFFHVINLKLKLGRKKNTYIKKCD